MKHIKILGVKNYLLYTLLFCIEVVINIPYTLLKTIINIIYILFDFLDDLFCEPRIIKLRKIKKIDDFHNKCIDKLRKEKE